MCSSDTQTSLCSPSSLVKQYRLNSSPTEGVDRGLVVWFNQSSGWLAGLGFNDRWCSCSQQLSTTISCALTLALPPRSSPPPVPNQPSVHVLHQPTYTNHKHRPPYMHMHQPTNPPGPTHPPTHACILTHTQTNKDPRNAHLPCSSASASLACARVNTNHWLETRQWRGENEDVCMPGDHL